MPEAKLLTEAEAISAHMKDRDEFLAELRERGLIAQEPVDPLRVEAEALVSNWVEAFPADTTELALAALRRGMELRPPLTRDDCKSALIAAGYYPTPRGVDLLHAALTGPQQ